MKTLVSTINASAQFTFNGFSVSHITFDHSHYATLWAKCSIDQKLVDVNLIFPFQHLNNLMRFSGSIGETIQLAMIDEMMTAVTPPYQIILQNILGHDAIFASCNITATQAISTDQMYENALCLVVNDVTPISIIQQAKNLSTVVKHFPEASIVTKGNNTTSLEQLKKMYNYYLGLLELDIKEDAAKDKAQLTDHRLFVMAHAAYTHA
jgi:hypothetical protein